MSTPLEEIQAAKKAFDDAVALHGRNAVVIAVREVFEKVPEVQSIRWQQYTPYFNDGDACEFSVNDPSYKFDGVDEEAGDYGDGYIDNWSLTYNSETKPLYEKYGSIFQSFAHTMCNTLEKVLEVTFGDHIVVQIDRGSEDFLIEDYYHD